MDAPGRGDSAAGITAILPYLGTDRLGVRGTRPAGARLGREGCMAEVIRHDGLTDRRGGNGDCIPPGQRASLTFRSISVNRAPEFVTTTNPDQRQLPTRAGDRRARRRSGSNGVGVAKG